jgi:hypothetical protein
VNQPVIWKRRTPNAPMPRNRLHLLTTLRQMLA